MLQQGMHITHRELKPTVLLAPRKVLIDRAETTTRRACCTIPGAQRFTLA